MSPGRKPACQEKGIAEKLFVIRTAAHKHVESQAMPIPVIGHLDDGYMHDSERLGEQRRWTGNSLHTDAKADEQSL